MNPELIARAAEFGVVAVSFVFVLRWMMTRFEKELEDIRETQVDTAQEMIVATRKLQRAVIAQSLIVTSMQKQLLSHDLTVTGINPSTGSELNERAEKAVQKYEELQHSLNDCQVALRELISS